MSAHSTKPHHPYFEKVRVRYAPSPTGYLHVGGARTALYNYLFAKQQGGDFILRIEDTDQARSTNESLKMVIEDLVWLGLNWDEGPDSQTLKDHGNYGPYRQSERLSLYKKIADQLLAEDKAYYCFMTDAEIDTQRAALKAQNKPPHIDSPFEKMPLSEAQKKLAAGEKAVVRFRTKQLKKDYILNDLVRGDVKFPSDMVGDFVLLRSDGMPVYNFCCVVDDHEMKISHILRAEEHLPNSLRQLMIYEAMNWPLPQFGHVSLVLDEDRQKLSKRKGATSCNEFKNEGYLPQALNNFIALLGWSHPEGKELLTLEEMVKAFDVKRLHSAGAVFDGTKLKWMNAQYLRALSDEALWSAIQPFLNRENLELPTSQDWQMMSVRVFRSAMEVLSDAKELYRPLSKNGWAIQPEASEAFQMPTTKKALEIWLETLSSVESEFITEEQFLKFQDIVKTQAEVKGKNLFFPIRVAVIGKPHGTELKIIVPLIPRATLIARAKAVLEKV